MLDRLPAALHRLPQAAACAAVLGTMAAAPLASATPTLGFSDSLNATPGTYQAGSTFTLDISLLTAPGDLSGIAANDLSTGVAFDLRFDALGPTPISTTPLTLVSRSNTGSPFSFFSFPDPLADVDVTNTGTGLDLGQITFGAGEAPGTVFLGTYTFAIAAEQAAGNYILSFADNVSPVAFDADIDPAPNEIALTPTRYSFAVTPVPEPATAGLLLVGLTALARRRRA